MSVRVVLVKFKPDMNVKRHGNINPTTKLYQVKLIGVNGEEQWQDYESTQLHYKIKEANGWAEFLGVEVEQLNLSRKQVGKYCKEDA